MQDPTCSPACNDQLLTDAVYNTTTGLWACCGVTNGKVHCNTPTTEIFAARAPAEMSSTFSVGELITAAASSTTVASSNAVTSSPRSQTTTPVTSQTTTPVTTTAVPQANTSSSPTPTSSPPVVQTQTRLSTGIQVVIGVSCTISGLIIIGTLLILWRRWYRKKQNDQRSSTISHPNLEQNQQFIYPERDEAPDQQPPKELESESASVHVIELASNDESFELP